MTVRIAVPEQITGVSGGHHGLSAGLEPGFTASARTPEAPHIQAVLASTTRQPGSPAGS